MVEVLLKGGANVNAKDNSGWTPLHFAARNGKKDVVKALLDKGANVNAQNDEGKTPSNLANDKGIQNLLQSVKEANDKLLKAAESGNIDDVKNLLGKEGKAQVNATDEKGKTPLHWAAQNNNKEVVEALLGEGADINAQDNDGKTPLHWAAQFNREKEVVEVLLTAKKVDINIVDKDGKTPLDLANDKGIQNLLRSVKEANDKLLKAAESGNIDDVKNLLREEGKARLMQKIIVDGLLYIGLLEITKKK